MAGDGSGGTQPQPLAAGGLVRRLAGRLRLPYLFLLTAAVFLIDLVVPDPLPFIDEVLLGLATALIGSLKRRRSPDPPAPGGS